MSLSYRIEERFAPLTRSVSKLVNQATPAATKLWVWLRQEYPPEKPFTICLKEVAEVLGYSVRWLRNTLTELESFQLVEQMEQWWGQTYSLVIHNPGQRVVQKSDSCSEENDQSDQKTSQKQPLKPHSGVRIPERKKEEENNGCGDVFSEQEGDGGKGKICSIEPEFNPSSQLSQNLSSESLQDSLK